VLGQDGKPVVKAKVHIADTKPLYGSRVLQFHETDFEGRFAINHVSWGTYVVLAGKEEDGYPDTTGVFYSNLDVPTVDLGPLSPTANVTIHLGPRAGVLHIASISDAITGKKVRNAAITLRRADNPKFFMTVSSSLEEILVPSTTAVTLEIEEQGYQAWPGVDKSAAGSKIKLGPGEVFSLDIKLQPLPDPRAEISRIIHRTLYAQPVEITHGTTLTSPLSPSKEDIQHLRELGSQAITFLSAYLEPSANILDQQVVLRLLFDTGGEPALDLLAQFAERAQHPVVRARAVEWLAKDKRPKDMLLLRRISLNDPDAEVRETAAKLLKDR
jgi:hypothetical protein